MTAPNWPELLRAAPEAAQVDISGLTHHQQVAAILTASPEAIKTARGVLNRSKARSRPKVMRPCPKCAAVMGARELQQHKCG